MEFTKEGYPEVGPEYLKPTEFLDFDVQAVVARVAPHLRPQ